MGTGRSLIGAPSLMGGGANSDKEVEVFTSGSADGTEGGCTPPFANLVCMSVHFRGSFETCCRTEVL